MAKRNKEQGRLIVRDWRARNKANGLCHCGSERYVDPMTNKQAKLCLTCRTRSERAYARRKETGGDSQVPSFVRPPAQPIKPPKRAYAKLVVEIDPMLLQEVSEFLTDYDDMPLAEAIAEGLSLLMWVTRDAERNDKKREATAIRDRLIADIA